MRTNCTVTRSGPVTSGDVHADDFPVFLPVTWSRRHLAYYTQRDKKKILSHVEITETGWQESFSDNAMLTSVMCTNRTVTRPGPVTSGDVCRSQTQLLHIIAGRVPAAEAFLQQTRSTAGQLATRQSDSSEHTSASTWIGFCQSLGGPGAAAWIGRRALDSPPPGVQIDQPRVRAGGGGTNSAKSMNELRQRQTEKRRLHVTSRRQLPCK